MTDREDIDALAAEYALGTLDAGERTAVAARRQRERDLDAAIRAWEHRLAPLAESVPPVEPARDLLADIEARLDRRAVDRPPSVVVLETRLARWRRAAGAAGAIAAALLLTLGIREYGWRQMPTSYVAVFNKDEASPSFVMTVDLETRRLTVRMVAAEPLPGKSYQLWIASEKLGPSPRSLGLVGDREFTTRATLAAYDPSLVAQATFGVSLEPAGGSPTGLPTGPVIHAKLIQATH